MVIKKRTAERMGGMLNLHQKKGAGQGTKLSPEPSVNKHRKGSASNIL
jgi:hypothetical protein